MTTVTTWTPGIILASIDLSPEIVAAIQAQLTPAETVALTAWREAEARFMRTGTNIHGGPIGRWIGNPADAMHDVMEVVDARVHDGRPRWHGFDHKAVCLERDAFSCWMAHAGADDNHDPHHLADNFETLMTWAQKLIAGIETPPTTLLTCLAMAEVIVSRGVLAPVLDGATHYFAPDSISPPAWSQPPAVMTAERFGHRFFKGVK